MWAACLPAEPVKKTGWRWAQEERSVVRWGKSFILAVVVVVIIGGGDGVEEDGVDGGCFEFGGGESEMWWMRSRGLHESAVIIVFE